MPGQRPNGRNYLPNMGRRMRVFMVERVSVGARSTTSCMSSAAERGRSGVLISLDHDLRRSADCGSPDASLLPK